MKKLFLSLQLFTLMMFVACNPAANNKVEETSTDTITAVSDTVVEDTLSLAEQEAIAEEARIQQEKEQEKAQFVALLDRASNSKLHTMPAAVIKENPKSRSEYAYYLKHTNGYTLSNNAYVNNVDNIYFISSCGVADFESDLVYDSLEDCFYYLEVWFSEIVGNESRYALILRTINGGNKVPQRIKNAARKKFPRFTLIENANH